jgi:hypothetical protein
LAKNWLGQFEEGDRELAKRLLDDLIIIAPSAFQAALMTHAEAIIRGSDRPVAFYPVWDIQRHHKGDRQRRISYSLFPLQGRGLPSLSDAAPQTPEQDWPVTGSEGSAIHLISNLKKIHPDRVLDRPSLSALRATRTRRIIFVDDIAASGGRANSILKAFYRHPTIKSWCSYPGLMISVLVYSADARALQRIKRRDPADRRQKPKDVEVLYEQAICRGRSYWTARDTREFEKLCRDYGSKTGRPFLPLGFRNMFNMVMLPTSVPNTTPAIFWANSKTWHSLFPNRVIPSDLIVDLDQQQADAGSEKIETILSKIRQARLANGDWRRLATKEYQALILVLAVMARGFRHVDRLVEITGYSRKKCSRLFSHAVTFGMINDDGVLTESGHAELEYARRIEVGSSQRLAPDNKSLYFPATLKVRQKFI